MLQIYVCGAGGVGKTTLIGKFLERCKLNGGYVVRKENKIVINIDTTTVIQEVARRILSEHGITSSKQLNDKNFMWKLQGWIIKQQMQEAFQNNKPVLIGDRSILDPMIHGLQMFKEKFDSSLYSSFMEENEPPEDKDCDTFCRWLFLPFTESEEDMKQIMTTISSYRNALFVLVHPRPNQVSCNQSDPLRYPMDVKELEEYTTIYQHVLNNLRIPFINMNTSDLQERLEQFEDSLIQRCSGNVASQIDKNV